MNRHLKRKEFRDRQDQKESAVNKDKEARKVKIDGMALKFTGSFEDNPGDNPGGDVFPTWARLMYDGVQRLNDQHDDLVKQMTRVEKKLSAVEIKSGFWGMLAGLIAGLTGSAGFDKFMK